MKQLVTTTVTMLVLLAASLHVKAQEQMLNAGSVRHLEFGDNMKIILIPSQSESNQVSFTPLQESALKVSFSPNRLEVVNSSDDRVQKVLFVMVHEVQSIRLGANSTLMTQGTLAGQKLELQMERGSMARIFTNAKVIASGLDDAEVELSKVSTGGVTLRSKIEVL